MYVAIYLRLNTAGGDILLDYDPWWFFRHAQEIVDNNLLPPKWDILSYYPPGRPVDYQLGWSYTLAIFYLLAKTIISSLTLMKFSAYFVAIFSGLSAIPAYIVGKMITNKWGGLITAFLATVTPTFLTVSMAGYPDSDAVDVFYTFLAIAGTLYAFKKMDKLSFSNFKDFGKSFIRYLPHLIPALIAYWLFAFNWNTSFYIYFIFVGFLPILLIFTFLESLISKKEGMSLLGSTLNRKNFKGLLTVIVSIGIISTIISSLTSGWPFNTISPITQLLTGLNFLGGQSLIVNISVAELQSLNIFSSDGFLTIVGRIGIFPVILGLMAFLVVALKLFYKKEISTAEYLTIIWLIISFWLITRGIRFSLLFSLAVATSAGFVAGNLIDYFKNKNNLVIKAIIFGIVLFGIFWHFSDNLQFSYGLGGFEIGQNWKDALSWMKTNADSNTLVATWWDPGHIITGLTGLRVHADGAHCSPDSCIPYNHNIRIQDMGRIFSTSSESEAVNILKKYTSLTPQQCDDAKKQFGDLVPSNACDKVTKIYFIASSDLIGKYYWLSYFGTGEGKNFIQLPYRSADTDDQGNIKTVYYGDGSVALTRSGEQFVPVYQGRYVIKQVVYFQNGQPNLFEFSNATNTVDGLLWIDSSLQYVIFMEPTIRDSIFTRMFFFNGQGLTQFKLMYQNPEIKIYELDF